MKVQKITAGILLAGVLLAGCKEPVDGPVVPKDTSCPTYQEGCSVKPSQTTPKPLSSGIQGTPAPAKAAPTKPARKEIHLRPRTGYGSQKAIDTGALVLWRKSPWLLAGHNHMGWHWIDDIPNGTIVVVETTAAKGRYVVIGHRTHPVKGGPTPRWIYNLPSNYLLLQTCRTKGMAFSILKPVA